MNASIIMIYYSSWIILLSVAYYDFVDMVLHTPMNVCCYLPDILIFARVRVESWDELHHGGKSFGPRTGVVRAGMRGSRAGPRVRPNSPPNTVAGRAGRTTQCIAAPPNTWWITDEPPNAWRTIDRFYPRLFNQSSASLCMNRKSMNKLCIIIYYSLSSLKTLYLSWGSVWCSDYSVLVSCLVI